MLAWIFELMPLCVVRWFAVRYLERLPMGSNIVVMARRDVVFLIRHEK